MIDLGFQRWFASAGATGQGAGARHAAIDAGHDGIGSRDSRPHRAPGGRVMTRRRVLVTRILTLVGIAGPICYIGFVSLLGLLWAGYDPIKQTQSELGAVDAPHGLLMNVAGFMALGVVILAFAAAYHLVLRPSAWRWAAAGLMVLAGVGMVTVGFFPCDAGCVDVTRTGELHSTFSMPGAIGLPAAVMLSSLAFRSDGRLGPAWQLTSLLLGLATLASGPIVAADLLSDHLGLLQRAGMWTPVLWMSAVSLRLHAMAQPPIGAGVPSTPAKTDV
jgi:hypothetical protein